MSEIVAKPARGSLWRKIGLVILMGLLVLLLGHTSLDLWAGRRIADEIARLETLYGSLAESTLTLPAVPAADNRARVVRAAAALVIPGATAQSQSVYRFIGQSSSPPVPPDVRAFAEANRNAVLLAADARSKGQSNWEAGPPDGGNQPPLMEVRILGNAIYVTSQIELEAGRVDDASKTVMSGLAVAASMRQEPWLIAQLVRIAAALQQLEAVEQLITRAEPSKASLEELAKWLAENRNPNPLHAGLLGELKYANASLAAMEKGNARTEHIAADAPRWFRWPLRPVARPLVRLARVRYLQQMGHLLEVQRGSRPRPPFLPHPNPSPWNLPSRLTGMFRGGLERAIETGDLFVSALGATELGVALRRYRLDHGSYPEQLSALAPAYLPEVPIDPFTGRPPTYARRGAGFTLKAEGGREFKLAKSALEWTVEK